MSRTITSANDLTSKEIQDLATGHTAEELRAIPAEAVGEIATNLLTQLSLNGEGAVVTDLQRFGREVIERCINHLEEAA